MTSSPEPLEPPEAPKAPETPEIGAPATDRGASGVADHPDIFFAAVETTRMPMVIADPHRADNPIVYANNAFLSMTGYDRDEVVGYNCRFLQGRKTDRETVREIRLAVAERREIATEILNYRKDGSTFWNALFVSPVFSPEGDLLYFFAWQLDVSRRREAEEGLHQAQKMEALGQLTGGIAHDFNNLLQVISGYGEVVQVLAERGRDGAEMDVIRLGRAAEAIRTATDRAAKLIHQLLAFARKQRLDGRAINLNDLIGTMSEIAERTLGDQIAVRPLLTPDLWNCRIDPTQAEVALLNVMLNARDAMPEGGTLTIETGNRIVDDVAEALRLGVREGRYAQVCVGDTGTGMPPEVQARIMEPFFTTKPEGKGTGLGLAMVYGFARQSGGAVEIASEVGHGTSVRLLFPVTDQPVTPEAQPAQRSVDREGTETILVVDDRPDVAETAGMMLGDFGYTAIVANGSEQALRVLDGEARIDLLFTDLVLPGGMNGVVLARAVRERRPSVRVLLTTGFAEASLERTDAGGSEFEIIMKPYRRLDLARRVRRVLDGPTGVA